VTDIEVEGKKEKEKEVRNIICITTVYRHKENEHVIKKIDRFFLKRNHSPEQNKTKTKRNRK
jgi:hypothetical protein